MFLLWYRLNYIHFRHIGQSTAPRLQQVQSWVNPLEICGGQIRIGTGLSLSSSVFSCPYQPLLVMESEDIFSVNANKTVYPVLNLCHHKQHFIKQRSIQNCSQYVKGILHFCASVTNYHSCVPTITCHYFIIH